MPSKLKKMLNRKREIEEELRRPYSREALRELEEKLGTLKKEIEEEEKGGKYQLSLEELKETKEELEEKLREPYSQGALNQFKEQLELVKTRLSEKKEQKTYEMTKEAKMLMSDESVKKMAELWLLEGSKDSLKGKKRKKAIERIEETKEEALELFKGMPEKKRKNLKLISEFYPEMYLDIMEEAAERRLKEVKENK